MSKIFNSFKKTLKKHWVRLFQGKLQEKFGFFLHAIKMERLPAFSLRKLCFGVMADAYNPLTALTGPWECTGLPGWQLPLCSIQLSLRHQSLGISLPISWWRSQSETQKDRRKCGSALLPLQWQSFHLGRRYTSTRTGNSVMLCYVA